MVQRSLDLLTRRAYYVKFLREFKLREDETLQSEFGFHGSAFQEWLKKRTPESKPLHQREARIQTAKSALTRLKPDWFRKVEMSNLRMKTLLRIYLSKWFYKGLSWYEADLVEELSRRIRFPLFDVLTREELYHTLGYELMQYLYWEDSNKSFDLKGWEFLDKVEYLLPLLFTQVEYEAIWKLRSFQSLRDFLFTDSSYESLGKKGVKKRRIRGYRDGKAKTQDPTRTALARQVDVLFYEERFIQRWQELQDDIETQCSLKELKTWITNSPTQ